MAMIKVSIIIPVYNKEKYLSDLWNDLKNQSFQEFECIFIDDGSTDGSGRYCDEIVSLDQRFKVIHTSNKGVSNARNIGLDVSKGKFITFIDADDRIHRQYIENLYHCITENKVDFVISGIKKKWIDSERNDEIKIPYKGRVKREKFMPEFAKIQFQCGIYGFCVAKIMKRDLIGDVRFNNKIRLAEDLEFYLSLYSKIEEIYFDDKYYYYYLQEAENSSMQKKDHEIDYYTQLMILNKMKNMVEKINYMNDDNRNMIINRMNDYIFFTLYHAPRNKIKKYCSLIRKLNIDVVDLKDKIILQKIILKLFQHQKDNQIYKFICLYRFIKKKNY